MSENIKAAIEYGVELSKKQEVIHVIDGKTYYDERRADLRELEPTKLASALRVSTLSGLVGYLKSRFDTNNPQVNYQVLINVESATHVKVYSPLNQDKKRESLIESSAVLDKFPFGQFVDSENFIIQIQSFFQRTREAENIIRLASGIKIEGGADLRDNGISQTVTVREGANVESIEVPNPIDLQPFRTFLEVDQPTSAFVFRIDKAGRCALFEADGGIWKNEAMENIKDYLEEKLSEEITTGYVTVIA